MYYLFSPYHVLSFQSREMYWVFNYSLILFILIWINVFFGKDFLVLGILVVNQAINSGETLFSNK